jgi:hypothetical protein
MKKIYNAPQITVHGSASELTRGNGVGSDADVINYTFNGKQLTGVGKGSSDVTI